MSPDATMPAGTLVEVPLAPATGNPGGPMVAVEVVPWYASTTIWSGLTLLGGSILDALVNVLLPILVSGQPLDLDKLWRPCLVAVLGAVIAWRRNAVNTVVGSGKP